MKYNAGSMRESVIISYGELAVERWETTEGLKSTSWALPAFLQSHCLNMGNDNKSRVEYD